jgi:Tol biopolymer transport system component
VKNEWLKENGGWRVIAVALLFTFNFSTPVLHAQCGVKVKSGDRSRYEEALAHYNSRNFKTAAVELRKIASRNPKAADPQFWLGMTAVHDGFNATGIRRYFTKCIELCPNYPNALAHFYMGMIHYTDKRYDDAVAELNEYFALANGNDDKAVSAVYEEASNYLYWSQFLSEAMLNMAPFDPQRVTGVSSKHNEALPYLSPDGRTFYYLRELPVEEGHTFYHRELEHKQWRLCYSVWQDSTFSRGVEMPPPFNSGDPEGSVSITADGNELYYSIIRKEHGYANSDIYCVRRVDGRWQQPEALGPQVNGERSWESQPSVSPDGSTLLFASNRKGGHGGIDIWRCHRLPNGDWSRAENLGDNINTPGNDKMPFLAADSHTLYFLSDGWQSFGGYDIFFCNLNDTYGNRPTNLGLPINTEDDEVSFGITPDSKHAYFAGHINNSRSTDILMFDLYPAARPDAMRLHRITVKHGDQSRDTVMMLYEQYTNVISISDDGTLPCIVCGKARQIPASVTLQDSVVSLAVTFITGSRLTTEGEMVSDALAEWLLEHPRVNIAVRCPKYTDAKAVHDRLNSKGLRAGRVTIDSGTAFDKPQIALQ